jgi:hypothetical protein
VGERVEAGQPVALFSQPRALAGTNVDPKISAEVRERLRSAFTVGSAAPEKRPLILEVIR